MRVGLSGLTMAEYFRDVKHLDAALHRQYLPLHPGRFRGFALLGRGVFCRRLPAHAGYRRWRALQERITSTPQWARSRRLQAVYVPADDLTNLPPATTFTHLDATTVPSRDIASQGIYPAVDPLDSTSPYPPARKLSARSTTRLPAPCSRSCSATRSATAGHYCHHGTDELSEEDKITVARPRKVQRFPVPVLPCCGAVHPVCPVSINPLEGDRAWLQDDFERRVRQHPLRAVSCSPVRLMMSWPRPSSSKAVAVWQLSRSKS